LTARKALDILRLTGHPDFRTFDFASTWTAIAGSALQTTGTEYPFDNVDLREDSMRPIALTLVLLTLISVAATAEEAPPPQTAGIRVAVEAETGTVKVLHHTYQSGTGTTDFDLLRNGGQELLFPFERYTAMVHLGPHHQLRFLYQPLQVDTRIVAQSAFTIDTITFPVNTPVDITYSFPFYRLTWLYDFLPGPAELAAGAALQLRNASIRFTSVDGTKSAVSQNLGPVPAIALAGRLPLGRRFFTAFDATGLWASSAVINGSTFEFEGSILDASARFGMTMADRADLFLNLRFLGGSAKGTSQYPNQFWTQAVNKYTANYLATASVTLGATLRF